MSNSEWKLANAPIVEAVIDIDCDLPPGFELAALEGPAREAFRAQYPKPRIRFLEMHRIESKIDEPAKHSAKRAIQALQFLHDDEKQLVQVRAQGFSFNRLAPYTCLDDYLLEIEQAWRSFLGIASPVQIRRVQLRYINRILLPMVEGRVELKDYLTIGPRLPDEKKLIIMGFLNQHLVQEVDTGHQANIILTSQPAEGDRLPLILDNCVVAPGPAEPENWPWILDKIQSLRMLKNRIFRNTLTERCLNLFQR
jgi:uncharacterized protein (TIGR04255 family)